MVLQLAADSVEKKLTMQASVIVGNYEFYYAAGKFVSLTGLEADEHTPPAELKEKVMAALEQFSPKDEKEAYLARMLERYRPGELQNEGTERLFLQGKTGLPQEG